MKTKFFFITILLSAFSSMNAQDSEGFELVLGDSLDHEASYIIPCKDGGYLLAGYKEMGEVSYAIALLDENGNYIDEEAREMKTDAWIWKINAQGQLEWGKNIGEETTNTKAKAITKCLDGGYAVACRESEFGGFEANYLLVKLDAKGQVQWKERHMTESDDTPVEIKQCADGHFIIQGNSVWFDYWDILIVKMKHVEESEYNFEENPEVYYKPPKVTIWEQRYGEAYENEEGFSLALDENGGCVVVGSVMSNGESGYDALILFIDKNGEIVDEHIENKPLAEDIQKIIPAGDNGYIICGSYYNGETFDSYVWVRKMSLKGEPFWEYGSDDPKFLDAIGLYALDNGNYALGYTSASGEDGKWEFVCLELSPDGEKQRIQSTEPEESQLSQAKHFCIGDNGRCILAGAKTTSGYYLYYTWVKALIMQ